MFRSVVDASDCGSQRLRSRLGRRKWEPVQRCRSLSLNGRGRGGTGAHGYLPGKCACACACACALTRVVGQRSCESIWSGDFWRRRAGRNMNLGKEYDAAAHCPRTITQYRGLRPAALRRGVTPPPQHNSHTCHVSAHGARREATGCTIAVWHVALMSAARRHG